MMKLLAIIIFFTINLKTFAFSMPSVLLKLSPTQRHQILKEKLVVTTKKMKEGDWPKVTIYGKINATPLESFAAYAAFNQQKNFVPDVIKSDPIKYISPTNVHVSYESNLPWPLTTSKYITGNIIEKNLDKSYIIKWYLVQSKSALKSSGQIQFFPYKNFTIYKYENFTIPDSFFASWFKNTMLEKLSNTIQAIVDYIEKTKKQNPQKFVSLIKNIHRAFRGEYIYGKIE